MSEFLGRVATVEVSSDGGTTFFEVGEVKDPTFPQNRDLHDATANDDGIDKVDLRGHKQRSLTFTCNFDSSDTGQNMMRAAYDSDTDIRFRYRPEGNVAGKPEYEFDGNFNSLELNTPTQGISELSADVQSSGAVTSTTV